MGFATVGYPTKHHKRRSLPHHDNRPAYYHHHRDLTKKRLKTAPYTDNAKTKILRKKIKRQKSTFQDLPPEIIQRIFIFSNDVSTMPLLSKYIYQSLRPTDSLLFEVIIERFFYDPKKYGIERCVKDGGYLVNPELFGNNRFAKFLLDHRSYFTNKIDLFAPKSLIPHLKDETIGTMAFDYSKLGKEEFETPAYFYHNFDIYFQDTQFLNSLSKYFTPPNISLLLENLIGWFFLEQYNYVTKDLSDVLVSIALFAKFSNSKLTSSDPLFTILRALYLESGSKPNEHWHYLFSSKSEDELISQKQDFIEDFITLYYTEWNDEGPELLSSPELWRMLHIISDLKLIDIVEKFGGRAHYNITG